MSRFNILALNRLIENLKDSTLFKITPYDFLNPRPTGSKIKREEYNRIAHLLECEKDYRRNIRDASVHTSTLKECPKKK